MPVTDVAALATIHRLLAVVQGDTGQSRRAANFLLAWWNAADCGGFDFTDLRMVDKDIADDMLAAAAFIATHHDYPTAYGLGSEFERLVADWRPQLLAGPAGGGS